MRWSSVDSNMSGSAIRLQMEAWTAYLLHGPASYLRLRGKSSAVGFVGVGNYYDHSGFATEST
jgi:hypothetical protein